MSESTDLWVHAKIIYLFNPLFIIFVLWMFLKIFYRLYLIWRRHFKCLPEQEDDPYLGIMILANEIILGEGYIKSKPEAKAGKIIKTKLFLKNEDVIEAFQNDFIAPQWEMFA